MAEIGLVYCLDGVKGDLDLCNPAHLYWARHSVALMRLVASPVEPSRMMGVPPYCAVGIRMVVLCSFGGLYGQDGCGARRLCVPASWLSKPLQGVPLGEEWVLFRIEERHLSFIISQQALDDVQVNAYGKVAWRQARL